MDTELDAMQKLATALSDLDPEARQRVLDWVAAKFGLSVGNARKSTESSVRANEASDPTDFVDFADLFYAAGPQSHAERSLVAAYRLASAGDAFPSQAINSLLKDLGFQIPNITDALSQNMREKPALVVQIKKSGSTRQARKLYKITDAGIRRVKTMIQSNFSTGESDG